MCKTKWLVLLLVSLLVTSSLTMVGLASAQSKPQVPTFSLTFTDNSYEMNSRHMRNGTIQIIIENQHFTPYKNSNNNTIKLFYHYQIKGHYDSKWIISPDMDQYIEASNTDKTIFEYRIDDLWEDDTSGRVPNIPADGQLDFQVEAFVGYAVTLCASIARRAEDYYTLYNGQTSGWTDTQTITVGQGNAKSTPNPTQTPPQSNPTTIPPIQSKAPTQQVTEINVVIGLNWEQTATTFLVIAVIALTVAVLGLYRKIQKISTNKPN